MVAAYAAPARARPGSRARSAVSSGARSTTSTTAYAARPTIAPTSTRATAPPPDVAPTWLTASHVTSPAIATATTIRHRLPITSRSGNPGTLYDITCSAQAAHTR